MPRPSPTTHHRTSERGWAALLLVFLEVAVPAGLRAQSDTTTAPAPFRFTPTVGLGSGMFAFYGDVGRDLSGYSPLVSRLGYEVRATAPITHWLEGGLYALHGRLGMNERSTTRNLNFESRITIGGFQLRYNFHQMLHPRRTVEPYIALGFESVEFLTKTDMYDAQGRAYHYWSDGTIRDIAENAPNAAAAVIIQRDYTYETDVRELNADGFGKYSENTWAVPLGIGARMDIGGGFDLRVGTTMHFTLTDLVDGVTDESVGDRAGDARNDRFLFTSVSLGYAIPMGPTPRKPRSTPLDSQELDLLVLNEDSDGDGVKDIHDECPGTPPGTKVDAKGCPLDSDLDGVPDHLDDEPDTPPGTPVDARGRTITDEQFLRAWLNWKDSANVNIVASRVESFGPMSPPKRPAKRVYVVKVGSQVEGISEDMIQRILSLPDVRTIERGDTTYYVVGDYASIPDALRRELELKGLGIEGRVMAEEEGRLMNVDKAVAAERDRMRGMGAVDESRDVTIRVQLGAFRYKLSRNIFVNIKDLVTIQGDDGLTRYYTGSFTDVNAAAAHKVRMLQEGFEGAFLVAFRGGKRITMKEAGAALTRPEDLRAPATGGFNKSMVRYRVQVGTYVGNVPMETMGKLIEMGDVTPVTSAESVRYFYGSFKDRRSADEARDAIRLKGFTDAFTVGDINGRIISAEEADRLHAEP